MKTTKTKTPKPKTVNLGSELVRRAKRFSDSLAKAESVSDKFTCRTVRASLRPKIFRPADVKKAREILELSQPLFAQFAGVSTAAVRDWEQAIKPPNAVVCRLIDEVFRNPQYFRARIRELTTVPTDS